MSIEAGGNAPFIVFGDADIDQAVEGAFFSVLVTFLTANRKKQVLFSRNTGNIVLVIMY